MSAFTNGFNFGFVSGMFNRMFCSFNPFCGCNFWGGFNFTPTFFIPTMNMSVFTPYIPPMVNMSFQNFTMPVRTDQFDWNSVSINSTWPSLPMGDSFTFNNTSVSENNSVSKSSSSSTSLTSYIPTKATSYLNMSDEEMKKIYGNYTKNITTLYNGTAEDLNKSLAKRGVLAGKGQAFMDAQKKYGISASVLAAICIQETGGTSSNARNKNNVGNISKGKGWKTYSSVEACIDDMGRLLKEKYVNEGLTALYQVNAKYCPVQDTRGSAASQSAWAKQINSISNTLEQA